MSDIRLFHFEDYAVTELAVAPFTRERHLQKLIEAQMEILLGVRFLATEYATGKTHRGRIDSLGLDENNCPVIVEYKRHSNENVINQGLFYLDWLLDHKAEFRWLVMEKLGKDVADNVEWSGIRLLCIAADFTRYDQHAISQMPRNIELLRYKLFDKNLLLLELINTQSATDTQPQTKNTFPLETDSQNIELNDREGTRYFARAIPEKCETVFGQELRLKQTVETQISDPMESLICSKPMQVTQAEIQALYTDLRSFIIALGDDVIEKQCKLYVAFRKLKNFACVIMYRNKIHIQLKLDPDTVALEEGFSRDVRHIGTWGTGGLRLILRNMADLERAKPLLARAYQEG